MSTSEWRWPGARWWKCDLHVHTPTSHDFERRDEVSHAQWVEAANRSGVQVIAVADHNASAGIEGAREGAQFVVFPGVELTVSPGVHLLALFDPSAGRDVVTALLGKVNIPADRFGDRNAASPLSVEDALSAITNSGGLCIAAHVDRDSGLLREVGPGLSRQSCLKHPGLIVKQLRLIKQRRQVIVVTHNANIVVNGDAELVVALDVRKGQAFKSCEGGLQEEAVRGEVCRIMEGGREAFRERYRRIARGDSASGDNDV